MPGLVDAASNDAVAVAGCDAFAFVKQLARELSAGPVELPSYPEVALSVQRLLTNDTVSSDAVVRILGAESVLAARVMAMANSAAMNVTGRPAADLRTAVSRLGFDALRSATIGFAIAQLRIAADYRDIRQPLSLLWKRSVATAAICHALARHGNRFNPDTAMLAGLVAGIGKLYLLTRISRYPTLLGDAATAQQLIEEWHVSIAKALLEHWDMAEEIVSAVADHRTAGDEQRTAATLADLLAVGVLLADLGEERELLAAHVERNPVAVRLGLDSAICQRLLAESQQEIATLRDALGH